MRRNKLRFKFRPRRRVEDNHRFQLALINDSMSLTQSYKMQFLSMIFNSLKVNLEKLFSCGNDNGNN